MNLFNRLIDFWLDVVFLQIYIPIRCLKYIKIRTQAFVVYSDGSYANKFGFITKCQKKGLDWPTECLRLEKEAGLRK